MQCLWGFCSHIELSYTSTPKYFLIPSDKTTKNKPKSIFLRCLSFFLVYCTEQKLKSIERTLIELEQGSNWPKQFVQLMFCMDGWSSMQSAFNDIFMNWIHCKNEAKDHNETNMFHCGKTKMCRILHSFSIFTQLT